MRSNHSCPFLNGFGVNFGATGLRRDASSTSRPQGISLCRWPGCLRWWFFTEICSWQHFPQKVCKLDQGLGLLFYSCDSGLESTLSSLELGKLLPTMWNVEMKHSRSCLFIPIAHFACARPVGAGAEVPPFASNRAQGLEARGEVVEMHLYLFRCLVFDSRTPSTSRIFLKGSIGLFLLSCEPLLRGTHVNNSTTSWCIPAHYPTDAQICCFQESYKLRQCNNLIFLSWHLLHTQDVWSV